MGYLKVLFKYDYELVKSPAGAYQWLAKDVDEEDMVVDAHDPSKKHRPMMTTADLSLKFDLIYEPIARRYQQNPRNSRMPSPGRGSSSHTATWALGPLSRPGGPDGRADLARPGARSRS